MGSVLDLLWGLLSYVAFTGAGGLVGYFFARKRTEHEVSYSRRVETVETIQDSVASIVEELWAAREYVSGSGPFDGAPAKRLDRVLEEFEGYYVRREIYYEDPDFEREHERVGHKLDQWLESDLPAAREGLADAFRRMLGVGRWRR
jgi:hypothetical protein